MKIVNKLYIITACGLILVVSFFGWYSYRGEVKQIETDMRLDAYVLGNALSPILSEIWKTSGKDKVTEYIDDANKQESLIHIRLVSLAAAMEKQYSPYVSMQKLSSLVQENSLTLWAEGPDSLMYLYTYVPVVTTDGIHWALELSESKAKIEKYTKAHMIRLVQMAFMLLAVAGLLIGIIGHWVVGKRMKKLVDYVHKIGKGNLSGSYEFKGNDEIALLGTEMNIMCRNLFETRINLIRENKARIETLEQLRHTERLATVGQLSSGVAHELGTPLNVVSGRAQSIADGNLSAEQTVKYAGIIREQTERMIKIIRQLLDFARRREPAKSPVVVADLIKEIFEILTPIARKQKVLMEFDDTDIDSTISVDRTQVQQILVNIIMNGIQAMPDGGTLKVDIHHEYVSPPEQEEPDKRDFLAVCIRDEGTGISEEDALHVFDPFFTTKDIGEGTGLGLSIAYGIVNDHGGWIDLQSEVGKASCFKIYFPVKS